MLVLVSIARGIRGVGQHEMALLLLFLKTQEKCWTLLLDQRVLKVQRNGREKSKREKLAE